MKMSSVNRMWVWCSLVGAIIVLLWVNALDIPEVTWIPLGAAILCLILLAIDAFSRAKASRRRTSSRGERQR